MISELKKIDNVDDLLKTLDTTMYVCYYPYHIFLTFYWALSLINSRMFSFFFVISNKYFSYIQESIFLLFFNLVCIRGPSVVPANVDLFKPKTVVEPAAQDAAP